MMILQQYKKNLIYLLALLLTGYLWAEDDDGIQPDEVLEYKKAPQVDLKIHVFNPPGLKKGDKRPAIVFFHGGAWVKGHPNQFYRQARYLSGKGMVAFSAEYRFLGKHNVTPKELVKDAKSAIRWLRKHAGKLGIDADMLAAGGGSAGGQLAAAASLIKDYNEEGEDVSVSCVPNALLLYNAVFDNGPGGWGHRKVKKYWKSISPIHNIGEHAPPTLVMLGTKDIAIPVKTAKKYKQLMDDAGVRCDLKLYEGQPHGFFNKKKYTETLKDSEDFLISIGYLSPKKS